MSRSDGSVECTFCSSAFTVTVSPVYPAFPMSVNGQPYPWPGRPADGMDPSMDPAMGGDPNAMGDPGYGGSLIPGGGDPNADPDADPDGDGDDDSGNPFAKDDDEDEDTEAEVGGKKQPPWLKKSSKMYSTATGGRLPEREYIQHLAISTSRDPNAMAARIRESRA